MPAVSSGGVSWAARSSGEKSSSSISAAVTPRAISASHFVDDGEHGVDQRRRLGRRAVRVVVRQRVLLQHALAQQAPGEQHHPLVPGQRAGADQFGQLAEPVGFGQQGGHPGPARRPVRVAVARVPGTELAGVAGERAGSSPTAG